MKIIYFNYAAFALLLVILLSAAFRKVGRANGNRAFLATVIEVLITTVMDIGAVALDNAGAGHVGWKYFFHSGYLIFHTLTAFVYLIYLISLTDSWQRLIKVKSHFAAIIAPAAIYVAAHIVGYLGGPRVFFINEADVYTRGETFILGYIVGGIYLLFGLFYIVRYRKLFTTRWIITLFLPYPVILLAMIVEFLYPWTIIELFFNALAFLFVYINIQRPEETIDISTGLENAKSFEEYTKRVYFNQTPTTCIMLNVHNLDAIRILLDHASRNRFVRSLAQYIAEVNEELTLKANIFYGHQGKFYMMIDQRQADGAAEAANLLLNDLNRSRTISGIEVHPQTSICIADIPDDIPDFEGFLRFCNNNQRFQTPGEISYIKSLLSEDRNRILMNIDRIIADAIEFGRLEVYYQPIYSIAEERYRSAEALLRLKDPEFGFIPPDLFIPAAEQNGAINRIWDFVINEVCRFVSCDEFKHLGINYVEVNLSAIQCMQEKLADKILQTINTYGVDRSRISLEITETALVYNQETLIANLKKLSDAGIIICLDDYGTGYSDTRRILDLPLGIVKLDKGFIAGIEQPRVRMVVRNMVRMLKGLGLEIVAEGVETRDDFMHLKECGCDFIQGFYFSKPLPKADFIKEC